MVYNIYSIANQIQGADGEFLKEINKARKAQDKERFKELLDQYKISDDVLRQLLDWYYLAHLEE